MVYLYTNLSRETAPQKDGKRARGGRRRVCYRTYAILLLSSSLLLRCYCDSIARGYRGWRAMGGKRSQAPGAILDRATRKRPRPCNNDGKTGDGLCVRSSSRYDNNNNCSNIDDLSPKVRVCVRTTTVACSPAYTVVIPESQSFTFGLAFACVHVSKPSPWHTLKVRLHFSCS